MMYSLFPLIAATYKNKFKLKSGRQWESSVSDGKTDQGVIAVHDCIDHQTQMAKSEPSGRWLFLAVQKK